MYIFGIFWKKANMKYMVFTPTVQQQRGNKKLELHSGGKNCKNHGN
jgi:hypothetical protein